MDCMQAHMVEEGNPKVRGGVREGRGWIATVKHSLD